MTRSLLSTFKPALQIQLFLSALFHLNKTLSFGHQTHIISKLISPLRHTAPWKEDSGILHELKFQVTHLMKTFLSPYLLEIQNVLEKAIRECEKPLAEASSFEWQNPLFSLTAEFLHSCEPDENLYYFLLRHQEDCKKTFGRVFLLNFFKKKHQGLKQTEEFLIEKYHARGFFHLKPSIRTHLAGLKQC